MLCWFVEVIEPLYLQHASIKMRVLTSVIQSLNKAVERLIFQTALINYSRYKQHWPKRSFLLSVNSWVSCLITKIVV